MIEYIEVTCPFSSTGMQNTVVTVGKWHGQTSGAMQTKIQQLPEKVPARESWRDRQWKMHHRFKAATAYVRIEDCLDTFASDRKYRELF